MRTRVQLNTRVKPVTIKRIAALAVVLENNKTAVVEIAVRELAARQKIVVSSTEVK